MTPSRLDEMQDKEYRHGLVSAQIEIDIPLQIRALRKARDWKQPDLAEKAGMKQPRISAMEKPGGANFTLETLKRLAEAFDIALVVSFAPFSELVRRSDRFDPDEFHVPSFSEDTGFIDKKRPSRSDSAYGGQFGDASNGRPGQILEFVKPSYSIAAVSQSINQQDHSAGEYAIDRHPRSAAGYR